LMKLLKQHKRLKAVLKSNACKDWYRRIIAKNKRKRKRHPYSLVKTSKYWNKLIYNNRNRSFIQRYQ
jgi:hypothetical protein